MTDAANHLPKRPASAPASKDNQPALSSTQCKTRPMAPSHAANAIQLPEDAPLQRLIVRNKVKATLPRTNFYRIREELCRCLQLQLSNHKERYATYDTFRILALFDLANPNGKYQATLQNLRDNMRAAADHAIKVSLDMDSQDRTNAIAIRNAWQLWPWKLWADADWSGGLLKMLAALAHAEPLFGTASKKIQAAINHRTEQEARQSLPVRKQLLIMDVQTVLDGVSGDTPPTTQTRADGKDAPIVHSAKRARLYSAHAPHVNVSRTATSVNIVASLDSSTREQEPVAPKHIPRPAKGTIVKDAENGSTVNVVSQIQKEPSAENDCVNVLAEAQKLNITISMSQAAQHAIEILTGAIALNASADSHLRTRITTLEGRHKEISATTTTARNELREEVAVIITLRREMEIAETDAADMIAFARNKPHLFPPSVHDHIATLDVKREPNEDDKAPSTALANECTSTVMTANAVSGHDPDAAKSFFFTIVSKAQDIATRLLAAQQRDEVKSQAAMSATEALVKCQEDLDTAKAEYENSDVSKLRKKLATWTAVREKIGAMSDADLIGALDIKVGVDNL